MGGSYLIFYLFVIVPIVGVHLGLYKLFEKVGEPGWKALVPFLNQLTLQNIVNKEKYKTWQVIAVFIPFYNVFFLVQLLVDTCKAYGRNGTMDQTYCLLTPYFYLPYIGFDKNVVLDKEYLALSENDKTEREAKLKKNNAPKEWADSISFAIVVAAVTDRNLLLRRSSRV